MMNELIRMNEVVSEYDVLFTTMIDAVQEKADK